MVFALCCEFFKGFEDLGIGTTGEGKYICVIDIFYIFASKGSAADSRTRGEGID